MSFVSARFVVQKLALDAVAHMIAKRAERRLLEGRAVQVAGQLFAP